MIFETLYIVIRTFIFVYLVLNHPSEAINAFSIAQIASSVLFCCFYYGYFTWYIYKLNNLRNNDVYIEPDSKYADMQDFKFKSIMDFLPGFIPNEVISKLLLKHKVIFD